MIIEFQGNSSVEIAHLGTRDEIAMQIMRDTFDAIMEMGRRIVEALAIAFMHVGQTFSEFGMKLMESSK
jgi:hypothetical protein